MEYPQEETRNYSTPICCACKQKRIELTSREAAITQKKNAKESSEFHDQRSNKKHVLDKMRYPEHTFAAALHSNLPGVR
jgi:hypothetical protein